MYTPDTDTVVELGSVPPCDSGAPTPMLVADDHRVVLAYYAAHPDPGEGGPWAGLSASHPAAQPVVVIEFIGCCAHMFGPPNDEAFSGHPLYSRGLRYYSVSEVHNSSWLAALEQMNRVHPRHRADLYSGYRHIILAFHDSTFECITKDFAIHRHRGTTSSALQHVLATWRDA